MEVPSLWACDRGRNKKETKKASQTGCLWLIWLLVGHVGHECDLTGTLDGYCQLALMLCAYAAHPAGHDLAALGGALAEPCHVFIIDVLNMIGTENANFTPALAGTGLHLTLFHDEFYSYCIAILPQSSTKSWGVYTTGE